MCFKTGFNAKKTVALSFMLLAGITLLAHAVISHHHHDDNINAGECTAPNKCVDDCSLENIYIKFDNDKQVSQSLDFNFDLLPCFFALFPDYFIHPIVLDIGLPFRQKPYIIDFCTEFISRSTGLRAPPLFSFFI
jgi:hypothetical protein